MGACCRTFRWTSSTARTGPSPRSMSSLTTKFASVRGSLGGPALYPRSRRLRDTRLNYSNVLRPGKMCCISSLSRPQGAGLGRLGHFFGSSTLGGGCPDARKLTNLLSRANQNGAPSVSAAAVIKSPAIFRGIPEPPRGHPGPLLFHPMGSPRSRMTLTSFATHWSVPVGGTEAWPGVETGQGDGDGVGPDGEAAEGDGAT